MAHSASIVIAMAALGALLVIACVLDWRQRRVPNVLLVWAAAAALLWQAKAPAGAGLLVCEQAGALGLWPALVGGAAMLLIGFALWKLKLFGAGDAKLLAVVALFLGLKSLVPLLLSTLLAGGVLALVGLAVLALRQRFGVGARSTSPTSEGLGFSAYRLPYAWAVALGTCAVFWWHFKSC